MIALKYIFLCYSLDKVVSVFQLNIKIKITEIMRIDKRSLICLKLKFWLCVLDDDCITDSNFSPVGITENNTSSRTSSSWWVAVVTWGTALTAVNEEVASSAHFCWFLRLKVKSAWSLYWWIMHCVFAIGDFISGGWKWASVDDTLISGVEVTGALTAVCEGVDSVFTWASMEATGVLIEIESQGSSRWEWFAAVSGARSVTKWGMFLCAEKWDGDCQLENNSHTDEDCECSHVIGIILFKIG